MTDEEAVKASIPQFVDLRIFAVYTTSNLGFRQINSLIIIHGDHIFINRGEGFKWVLIDITLIELFASEIGHAGNRDAAEAYKAFRLFWVDVWKESKNK